MSLPAPNRFMAKVLTSAAARAATVPVTPLVAQTQVPLDDDKKILAEIVASSAHQVDDIMKSVSPEKLTELMEKIVDAHLDAKLATAVDARLDAKLATAMDTLRLEFLASHESQALKLAALITRADEMQASLVTLAAKSGEMQASLDGLTPLIARADQMQVSLDGLTPLIDKVGLMQTDLDLVPKPDDLEADFALKLTALDDKLTGQIASLGVVDVDAWLVEQKTLFSAQMQASSDQMTKHGKDVDSLKADVTQWTTEHETRFDGYFTKFDCPYLVKIDKLEAQGAAKIQELETFLTKQAAQYEDMSRKGAVHRLVSAAVSPLKIQIQALTDDATTVTDQLAQLTHLSEDLNTLAKSSLRSCYLEKLGKDKLQAVMAVVQSLAPDTVNAVNVHQLCTGMRETVPAHDNTLTEKLKKDGLAGLSEEQLFAAIPRDQSWEDLKLLFEHVDFNAKTPKFFEIIVMMAGHLPEIFPLS